MIINLDFSQINKATEKAFREMALVMSGEFTKAISDPVYAWPIGDSPRDVVDTGILRRSQQHQVDTFRMVATYQWPLEYAAAVHNGYLTRAGNAMPARPWTDKALAKSNPAQITERLIGAYL